MAKRTPKSLKMVDSRPRGTHPETAACIAEIAEMMLEGRWKGMKSRRELCAKWNLSSAAIGMRAAEASRLIAFAASRDPDSVRGMMIAEVARIGRAARIGLKEVSAGEAGIVKVKQPNHQAGIAAVRLMADLWRLSPTGSDTPPDWSTLPPEKQLERIAEARARLDALEETVRAAMATPVPSESEAAS